jgi:1-acyl-sn-glycerol-3-phosphate acyltransferase
VLLQPKSRGRGPWLYRMAKTALGPILRHCWDIRVEGLDRLPENGPFVVAANHRSFMDSIFLALVIPRPVTFIAKSEYFEKWQTAWIFRASGQIPLRRGVGSAAGQALTAAREVLAENGVVGIYPEGTRSRDGLLHRGNTGPARLALTSGAPIVPVGLVGTDAIQAPGEVLPHPFRPVTVRIGTPQHLSRPDTKDSNRPVLRQATDQLMQSIAHLCEQPYQDRYATRGALA